MTGGDTVTATVPAGDINDPAGNSNTASTSTDNQVTYDSNPTVTIEQKLDQPDPTNIDLIKFTITFSEDVSGFTIEDIVLSGSPTATISSLTGSGSNYEVEITGLHNGDILTATIPANVVVDLGGNGNEASTSTDNQVTYDTTPPTVTINQKSGQADPTNVDSAEFTVVFSEPINESTFSSSDITLFGTTGTVTTFTKVGTDNTTWEVTVTGMSDGNTVIATIPAGGINDPAGNSNTASTSTDNQVRYDITKPTVTVNQKVGQPDPTNINSAQFTIILSEPINEVSFTPSIISIAGGAGTITGFQKESATEWSVTIAGMNSVSTISVSIPAGKFTDLAGNSNTASTSTDNSVTYDATPPIITVDTLFTQNRSPKLTGTVDDNSATIKVTVNGIEYSATNNANGTWTLASSIINTLPDGTYNVVAKATDIVGNIGQDSTNNELTVDNVAPIITVANTITNKHTPTIGGSIDDDDTVILVTVNGNTYTAIHSAIGRWSLTIPDSVPNGTYNIVTSATDKAGNIGNDTTTGELIIDDSLLTVEVTIPSTQPTPTKTNQAIFIFTFSCQNVIPSTFTSDDIDIIGSTTAYVSNFTQSGQDTWQITVTGMTDGDTITAELPAGRVQNIYGNLNQESTENSAYVTYDITPPTVTVDNLTTNNTSPQLTGTVDDEDASIKVTVNGTEYSANNNEDGTWTLAPSTINNLSDGLYNVVVKATDLALNDGYDITTNELKIDTVKPNVTINQKVGQKDPTNINSALFTIVFSEPINESSFDASDVTLSGTTGAVTKLTKIDNLTYEIEVTYMTDGDIAKVEIAKDKISGPAGNGNTASTSTDNTVTYDITPPVIDITTEYGNTSSPTIQGTIDDPSATIEVTIDGNTYSANNNGNGTWTLPAGLISPTLTDIDYTVSVSATDLAGNTTTTVIEKVITIDTVSPTGSLNPIPNGIDTSPELSGTVDDDTAEVSVLVNGVKYNATNNGDGTWTLPKGSLLNLKPNIYDVVVSFTDPAGNSTDDPTSNELSILRPDADIPTVDTLKFVGNKPVITGTFDSKNTQELSILINDTKYTLGVNSELTTNGDTWRLDLSQLPKGLTLGIYDVRVETISRDGSIITDVTTNEISLVAPAKPTTGQNNEEGSNNITEEENTESDKPITTENQENEDIVDNDKTENSCKQPSIIIPIIIAILLLTIILLTHNNIITLISLLISCIAWYLLTKGDCQIYWIWPIIYCIESIIVSLLAKKKLSS